MVFLQYNSAFANPMPDGTIIIGSDGGTTLSDIVSRARSQNSNIKIYISLDYTSGSLTAMFGSTSPIFAIIFGYFFLKKY